MSDLYIQRIEDLTDCREVDQFTNRMLYEFADRVQKNRDENHSKPVTVCHHYIFNHIYKEFSISDLAKMVNLHPGYLSQLLKKETGVSFGEYIQRERVEEAKKLLTHSTHSLSDICSYLIFVTKAVYRDDSKAISQ